MNRRHLACGLCLLALHLVFGAGCGFGPGGLQRGHIAYNSAVKAATDDELLLNIVRLRYLDTLDFLATTSISSQMAFTLAGSAGGGGEFGAVGGGEFSYSTRPTFTFAPQRGKEFALRLIEPVGVDVLTHLVAADWDVGLLMRLFVRRLNGIDNELGLTDPRFLEATERLAELQLYNRFFMGFVDTRDVVSAPIDPGQVTGTDLIEAAKAGLQFERASEGDPYVLTSSRAQAVIAVEPDDAGGQSFIRLLGLEPGRDYYDLDSGTQLRYKASGQRSSVTMRTGSLLRAIIYLSQGIVVPDEHIEAGITSAEWPPGMQGTQILDGFFAVRASKKKPDARLRVSHRGYWFYIEDTDQASRYTFFHLSEAFRLGLTPTSAQDGPVLTLPVGGP